MIPDPTGPLSQSDAALFIRMREEMRELQAQAERMTAVCTAAKRWKAVADTPGASVWQYTERLDAAIDALVKQESPRRG